MSKRTRILLIAIGAALVLASIGIEIFVPAHHAPGWKEYWFEEIPGFYAALGFFGCWLIVVVSKRLGKLWLQRPEDYYGEADPNAE